MHSVLVLSETDGVYVALVNRDWSSEVKVNTSSLQIQSKITEHTPHDNARHCEYKQHAQQCFPNHGKSCLRHATDSLVFGLRTFDLSRCSLTSHSNYRYTLSQAYFTYVPLKYAIPILLGLAVLLWIRFLLRKRKCGSLLLPFLTTSPKF